MNKISRTGFLIVLLCFTRSTFAQDTLRLSHTEFLSIVKKFHPLAFRYKLENRIAEAEVLRARGNFDPVLESSNGAKTIDGTEYYRETNTGIEIPTWYGVSLNGSYNNIDGQRLNNSDTRGGLYQFGITIPLAKNFLYDNRRAVLEQAKFGKAMTAAEQKVLTNELLRDAENVYWQWVTQYEIYLLQKQTVEINRDRITMIRKSYEYGERAAIDTIEALSQLQSFELEQQDAYLQFIKASMHLSLYLWRENQQPYDLSQIIVPVDRLASNESYTNYAALVGRLATSSTNTHLSLIFYQQKQNLLESERRLKRQSFFPKADFTYNFLNKEQYKSNYFPLFQNNYQYGIKFGIPLFLRQARAGYQLVKAKILQNHLDIDLKRQEINTKVANYSNEVVNYSRQIELAMENTSNYEKLLQAEVIKYNNGESSLFLINSRENKLIEAREKMLELRFKFLKSYNELNLISRNFEEN